jgi:ribosomal protein S18 acetylase RimI-like enzyme
VSFEQSGAQVRRARAEEIPALAAMLARAFADDPVASWAWRPPRLRLTALARYQATRMRQLLEHDEIWTTDALDCAALWSPPGHWRKTPLQEAAYVPAFGNPRLLWRLPLVAGGWFGMELKHPSKPEHWYLPMLGTEPERQGRGLGSAVLAPVLERCDSDGVGAYLESSKESNIAFYARHGFRVTRELSLLRGPKMWAMWREPRP